MSCIRFYPFTLLLWLFLITACVQPGYNDLDLNQNPLLYLLIESGNSTDPAAASQTIYIHSSDIGYTGDAVQARATSSIICNSFRTTNFASLACTNDLAFISYPAGDDLISAVSNHGVPSAAPILSAATSTQISSDWAGLFDGNIDNSMSSAGVVALTFWTGSTNAGTLSANHCTGWSLNTGNGAIGDQNSTTGTFLSVGSVPCNIGYRLLCICW